MIQFYWLIIDWKVSSCDSCSKELLGILGIWKLIIKKGKKQEGQSPYGSRVSEKNRILYNKNKNIVAGQGNPM